jgi:hypothetical protein
MLERRVDTSTVEALFLVQSFRPWLWGDDGRKRESLPFARRGTIPLGSK